MPDVTSAADHDAELERLAQSIQGEWPRVVEVWEQFRVAHGIYLRAELSADRLEFLKQALWATHGKGQLRALLLRLQEAELTTKDVGQASKPFITQAFQLHSYVNGKWQPQDALVSGRRFMQACDHVCRISVEGEHKGTGVLIRPTVVATAAHVISDLVGVDHLALADSLKKLEVHFFHADDLLEDGEASPARPVVAKLHHDWLGYFSPPADADKGFLATIEGVNGINADSGPWDMALIRLAAPPREGLRGHRLRDGEPPDVEFGVHVLHHPATPHGKPMSMLWSIGMVNKKLGEPKLLRWLHNANTDEGSSGAPCFDNDWRIVALHQAGQAKVTTTNQNNRAVPIYRWAPELDNLAVQADSTPYVDFAVDENRVKRPVFGRTELQKLAWRAMTAKLPLVPRQRIFLVLGDSGTGKSFSSAILGQLAQRAGSLFASLDARNAANASPLEFARELLSAVGASDPLAVSAAASLTTQLRDVRNEIVPRLGQALEALAGQRSLCVVLDGLESCDTAAPGVAQLIEALVAALPQIPHVQLALIGWEGAVDTVLAETLMGEPTLDEILDHLLLTLAPPGFRLSADVRPCFVAIVSNCLDEQAPGEAYPRAQAAAEAARDVLKVMIGASKARQGGGG